MRIEATNDGWSTHGDRTADIGNRSCWLLVSFCVYDCPASGSSPWLEKSIWAIESHHSLEHRTWRILDDLGVPLGGKAPESAMFWQSIPHPEWSRLCEGLGSLVAENERVIEPQKWMIHNTSQYSIKTWPTLLWSISSPKFSPISHFPCRNSKKDRLPSWAGRYLQSRPELLSTPVVVEASLGSRIHNVPPQIDGKIWKSFWTSYSYIMLHHVTCICRIKIIYYILKLF